MALPPPPSFQPRRQAHTGCNGTARTRLLLLHVKPSSGECGVNVHPHNRMDVAQTHCLAFALERKLRRAGFLPPDWRASVTLLIDMSPTHSHLPLLAADAVMSQHMIWGACTGDSHATTNGISYSRTHSPWKHQGTAT